MPAYTLVDARIGYDFGVSQCDSELMCTYGASRRLLATLSYRWLSGISRFQANTAKQAPGD